MRLLRRHKRGNSLLGGNPDSLAIRLYDDDCYSPFKPHYSDDQLINPWDFAFKPGSLSNFDTIFRTGYNADLIALNNNYLDAYNSVVKTNSFLDIIELKDNFRYLENTSIYNSSLFRNDLKSYFNDVIESRDMEDYMNSIIDLTEDDEFNYKNLLASDIVSGFDLYSPDYLKFQEIHNTILERFDDLRKYLILLSQDRFVRALKESKIVKVDDQTVLEIPLIQTLLEYNDNVESFDDHNVTPDNAVSLFIIYYLKHYHNETYHRNTNLTC